MRFSIRHSSLKQFLFAPKTLELRGVRGRILRIGRVAYLTAREFRRDFCFERAASLTYVSLISLIPLSVLVFGFAGLLGKGEEIIQVIEAEIFPDLEPDSEFKKTVTKWLHDYISRDAFRAAPTGFVGLGALVGLLLSALGILVTAERVFARIWKLTGTRSYFQKFTAFWVILTTSPFMILASIWVGDLLVPEGGAIDHLTRQSWVLSALYDLLVPVFIGFVGFSLLYIFLPATRVRFGSAAAGALVAAILWEASKRGFYLYVLRVGAVTDFYKQLATVPLFLIWLYLTWLIILLGGEISFVHQNLSRLSRLGKERQSGPRYPAGFVGLYVLLRIHTAFSRGEKPPALSRVGDELGETPEELEPVVNRLLEEGMLLEDARSRGRYSLARHPATIASRDVLEALQGSELGEIRSRLPAGGAQLDGTGPGRAREPAPSIRPGRAAAPDTTLERLYVSAWDAFLGTFGGKSLESLGGAEDSPNEGA